MASTPMDDDDGFPLIEIFNIIYKGSVPELKPEDQRGTIRLNSLVGVVYAYKVDKIDESLPPIKFLDNIPVISKVPLCAFPGYLAMEYDLFHGAYKGHIRLDWDCPEPNEVLFDEVDISSGDNTGEICIRMGSFSNAVAAKLMVKLYLGESASAYVYGVVCASNSKLDSLKCTSVLFEKKQGNEIQLQPDGMIPLSKSCVAVPLHSELYVDVALTVNGVYHNFTTAFPAHTQGVFAQPTQLSTESMIQVLVAWDADDYGIVQNYDGPLEPFCLKAP